MSLIYWMIVNISLAKPPPMPITTPSVVQPAANKPPENKTLPSSGGVAKERELPTSPERLNPVQTHAGKSAETDSMYASKSLVGTSTKKKEKPKIVNIITNSKRPVIPYPQKRIRPVINIPDSFPDMRPMTTEDALGSGSQLNEIETIPLPRGEAMKQIFIDEYLVDEIPDYIARVSELVGGIKNGGPGQYFYFEADEKFVVGDAIFVFRSIDSGLGGTYMIQNAANARVISVLNNDGDRLYKAEIEQSVSRTVQQKDMIARGRMPVVEFSEEGRRVALRGEVAFANFDRRRFGGIGTYIFIEGGAYEGFAPNQLLSVMANPMSRNASSKYAVPSGPVALIKIVRVTENYATALVLATRDAVMPGDFTGSPDQFLEMWQGRHGGDVIDLSDDLPSDPWAPFRPYLEQSVPLEDYDRARRIPLDDGIDMDDPRAPEKFRKEKTTPTESDAADEYLFLPKESDSGSEEGLLDEGE